MYLQAMRIPFLAGREFNESDTDRAPFVCHINETLAKRFWPQGDAIGAHVMLEDNDSKPREAEVVGIIHDVKDRGSKPRRVSTSTYLFARRTKTRSCGFKTINTG